MIVVSDQRNNHFKNRLVENVSTIQLIAYFNNDSPSWYLYAFWGLSVFFLLILASESFFQVNCVRIYTSNISNAFSIFVLLLLFFSVIFMNSSVCRRQLWCEQVKDLRRFSLFFGILSSQENGTYRYEQDRKNWSVFLCLWSTNTGTHFNSSYLVHIVWGSFMNSPNIYLFHSVHLSHFIYETVNQFNVKLNLHKKPLTR